LWNDIARADLDGNKTAYSSALDALVEELSADEYTAIIDRPAANVYKELRKYYPKAKVLNTKRDAHKWAVSMAKMANSLDVLFQQPPLMNDKNIERRFKGISLLSYWMMKRQGISDSEIHPLGLSESSNPIERKSTVSLATMEAVYHRYQADVKRSVPAKLLVEWSVKDGWGPLCHGLDVEDCPAKHHEPFPSINSASEGFVNDMHDFLHLKILMYKIHPMLSGDGISIFLFMMYKNMVFIVSALAVIGFMTHFCIRRSNTTTVKVKSL